MLQKPRDRVVREPCTALCGGRLTVPNVGRHLSAAPPYLPIAAHDIATHRQWKPRLRVHTPRPA